jgi:hypothetical protein
VEVVRVLPVAVFTEVPRVEVVLVLVLGAVVWDAPPRVEVVLVLVLGAGVWDAPPRVEVVLVRGVVGIDDGPTGLRGVDMPKFEATLLVKGAEFELRSNWGKNTGSAWCLFPRFTSCRQSNFKGKSLCRQYIFQSLNFSTVRRTLRPNKISVWASIPANS